MTNISCKHKYLAIQHNGTCAMSGGRSVTMVNVVIMKGTGFVKFFVDLITTKVLVGFAGSVAGRFLLYKRNDSKEIKWNTKETWLVQQLN